MEKYELNLKKPFFVFWVFFKKKFLFPKLYEKRCVGLFSPGAELGVLRVPGRVSAGMMGRTGSRQSSVCVSLQLCLINTTGLQCWSRILGTRYSGLLTLLCVAPATRSSSGQPRRFPLQGQPHQDLKRGGQKTGSREGQHHGAPALEGLGWVWEQPCQTLHPMWRGWE